MCSRNHHETFSCCHCCNANLKLNNVLRFWSNLYFEHNSEAWQHMHEMAKITIWSSQLMLLLTSLFESGGGHEVYQVTNGPPDCYMSNTMLTFMVKFYTKKIGEEKIHCMELNLISLNAEVNFKYIFNLRNWQKKEIKSWHQFDTMVIKSMVSSWYFTSTGAKSIRPDKSKSPL